MAKSKLDKLVSAIEAAVTLKDGAVIGDQEGQYAQESVDVLTTSIDNAHNIAIIENVDDEMIDLSLKSIGDSIKTFRGTAIKAETKSNEPKEKQISLKGVVLKGSGPQKKGSHTIHLGTGIISFKDGEANVREEQEKQLRAAGYIE